MNFSPAIDFFGNTRLTATYLNYTTLGNINGPITVNTETGGDLSFIGQSNIAIHLTTSCRVFGEESDRLICAQQLNVDNPSYNQFNNFDKQVVAYFGYLRQ